MLAGRRAFAGDTTTDALAKILEREPDWTALPAATPPAIRRLLQRCLQKDPRRRLRDIADARAELDDDRLETQTPKAAPPRRRHTAAALAALAILLAGVGIRGRHLVASRTAGASASGTVHLRGAGRRAARNERRIQSSHPVAGWLEDRVHRDQRVGHLRLWIRRVDSVAAHRLAGTEDVAGPAFWSPDSRFLGFFAQGKLKRIDPAGGPALNIASIQANLGATWGADNVIVVAPVNRTVLHRVPAAGGTPEPITTLNASARRTPTGGRTFFPTAVTFCSPRAATSRRTISSTSARSIRRTSRPWSPAQSNAVYVSPGYLVYARDATLMAQRFDAAALIAGRQNAMPRRLVDHITPSSSGGVWRSADWLRAGVPPGPQSHGGRVIR